MFPVYSIGHTMLTLKSFFQHNIFLPWTDHTQQLNQIQSVLQDLLHRVTHLPSAYATLSVLWNLAPTPLVLQLYKEAS